VAWASGCFAVALLPVGVVWWWVVALVVVYGGGGWVSLLLLGRTNRNGANLADNLLVRCLYCFSI